METKCRAHFRIKKNGILVLYFIVLLLLDVVTIVLQTIHLSIVII